MTGTSTSLTAAVRRALRGTPFSLRALAREAEVPHSSLVRIQAGQLNASPDMAASLARALRKWGRQCNRLAATIEDGMKPRQKGD
jgi:hypothetical protein